MIRTLSLTLLLLSCLPMKAQVNLVPNPSFEEFNLCGGYLDSSEVNFPTVKKWFSGWGTLAYFNKCSRPVGYYRWEVPKNWLGNRLPTTGNAYLALINPLDSHSVWDGSFANAKLVTKLTKDSVYLVSFQVSLCEEINGPIGGGQFYKRVWAIAALPSLGIYFSSNKVYTTLADTIIPQIEYKKTPFLDDTANWMTVSGLYRAKGDEEYITIGNFRHLTIPNTKHIYDGEYSSVAAYANYYLDDVSVTAYGKITNSILDTIICLGDSITVRRPTDFDSTIWNDLDTTSIRVLNKPGKYWVTHISGNVSITDTFVLQIFNPQNTKTDTSLCNVSSVVLTAGSSPTYLWNTTDTTQTIVVNQSGMYWVTKTAAGCTGVDSFQIGLYSNPTIPFVHDTIVCFDEIAKLLLDAGTFKSYLWQPTGETSRYIYSTKAQPYLLSVTDSNNCSASKQFEVLETCPDFIFVPTAFTPNGDGVNDVFLPVTRSIETYEMNIVNRWGQVIFTTHNTALGWDGANTPADVYVVWIKYQPKGKVAQTLSQNVTLLR